MVLVFSPEDAAFLVVFFELRNARLQKGWVVDERQNDRIALHSQVLTLRFHISDVLIEPVLRAVAQTVWISYSQTELGRVCELNEDLFTFDRKPSPDGRSELDADVAKIPRVVAKC